RCCVSYNNDVASNLFRQILQSQFERRTGEYPYLLADEFDRIAEDGFLNLGSGHLSPVVGFALNKDLEGLEMRVCERDVVLSFLRDRQGKCHQVPLTPVQ